MAPVKTRVSGASMPNGMVPGCVDNITLIASIDHRRPIHLELETVMAKGRGNDSYFELALPEQLHPRSWKQTRIKPIDEATLSGDKRHSDDEETHTKVTKILTVGMSGVKTNLGKCGSIMQVEIRGMIIFYIKMAIYLATYSVQRYTDKLGFTP